MVYDFRSYHTSSKPLKLIIMSILNLLFPFLRKSKRNLPRLLAYLSSISIRKTLKPSNCFKLYNFYKVEIT